jgi:hypothetical protein
MVQLRVVQSGETKKLSKTNPKAKRKKRNKKQRRKGLVFDLNLGNRFRFSKSSDYQLPTYARTRTN